MADNDQERTEQPSSRRRDQAREDGSFAISKELSSFFMVAASLLVLYYSAVWIYNGTAELLRNSFTHLDASELTVKEVSSLFAKLSYKFLVIIAPVLVIPVFGAVAYALQTGFAFSVKSLEPKFSKLNPLEGFKRLFSLNSLAELVKSVLKVSVLTYVVYASVASEWAQMPLLIDVDPSSFFAYTAKVTFRIMTRTIWVLAVIAVIDYAFQRWRHEQGLKMSREELKEESKEMEGDPMVKARIKSIQRELARKRMMAEVPKADVVVTNPTHIAVALKYDKTKGSAPVVVAKGAGHIAEKIKELAKKSGVPVIENKPLARSLFKLVEIGKEIPSNLYKAVAEILAYVYRLKGKAR